MIVGANHSRNSVGAVRASQRGRARNRQGQYRRCAWGPCSPWALLQRYTRTAAQCASGRQRRARIRLCRAVRAGAPSPSTPRRWTWSFAPWGRSSKRRGCKADSQLGRLSVLHPPIWKKLLKAADLTALVDAYSLGSPSSMIPGPLRRQRTRSGAAYGRFGQVGVGSLASRSTRFSGLTLTFEEVLAP